jgi:menaquinone-dependent protoporphyrinogen oxidase
MGEQIRWTLLHELADAGVAAEIDMIVPQKVKSVRPYDAVVLGSGVYDGRWLESARTFVSEHADDLRKTAVWLFSSGPIGDSLGTSDQTDDAASIAHLVGAREHRVFSGRLIKADLKFGERRKVHAVHGDEVDERDFGAIRTWATEIAAALAPSRSALAAE